MSAFTQSRSLSRHQFDTLLKPLRPALLRFAVRRVGMDAAEDCVQQGVLSAWTRLNRLPQGFSSGEFAKLCFSCLHNACRSHLRDVASDCEGTLLSPDDLLLAVEQNAGESTLALPSLQCALYAALRDELTALLLRVRLTALQETCIRKWIQGETQDEIAAYFGVSRVTVRNHIAAGVKKLRAERERSEEQLDPDLARFFYFCIEDVKRSIYRKPQHCQADRDKGRQRAYRQRKDTITTRRDRTALEEKRRELEVAC